MTPKLLLQLLSIGRAELISRQLLALYLQWVPPKHVQAVLKRQ